MFGFTIDSDNRRYWIMFAYSRWVATRTYYLDGCEDKVTYW